MIRIQDIINQELKSLGDVRTVWHPCHVFTGNVLRPNWVHLSPKLFNFANQSKIGLIEKWNQSFAYGTWSPFLSQYRNWIQIPKQTGDAKVVSVKQFVSGTAPSFCCGFTIHINSTHKSTPDHKTKPANSNVTWMFSWTFSLISPTIRDVKPSCVVS